MSVEITEMGGEKQRGGGRVYKSMRVNCITFSIGVVLTVVLCFNLHAEEPG